MTESEFAETNDKTMAMINVETKWCFSYVDFQIFILLYEIVITTNEKRSELGIVLVSTSIATDPNLSKLKFLPAEFTNQKFDIHITGILSNFSKCEKQKVSKYS